MAKEMKDKISVNSPEYKKLLSKNRISFGGKGKGKKGKDEWTKKIMAENALEGIRKQEKKYAEKDDVYRITYNGLIVGLNQYKSLHWTKLKKKVDKVKSESTKVIQESNLPIFSQIELTLFHNTRFDNSNLTGTEKVIIDQIVKMGYLEDDTPKYYPKMTIEYASHLGKGTIIFQIKELTGR